jgi:two-component system response regulator DesR
VICVVIVEDMELLRDALAMVLASERDVSVTATLTSDDDVVSAAGALRPDVVIIGTERYDGQPREMAKRLCEQAPESMLLVLSGLQTPEALKEAMDAGVRGFLGKDTPPARLVQAVRRVADGERVVDPLLALAALHSTTNPLTGREREVMRLAAEGAPTAEIARRLFLATGTVRNHLSSGIRKAGARNRLEAVRRAQELGWL